MWNGSTAGPERFLQLGETAALPRSAKLLASGHKQLLKVGITRAQRRLGQQQRNVDACFGQTECGNPEGNLNQLFEIVARVRDWTGARWEVGEMLPNGILDHQFVNAHHKSGARDEEKESDRLERGDGRFGQAAIKVVDDDDQLIDGCRLQ